MKKNVIAIILSLALVIGAISPVSVSAAETLPSETVETTTVPEAAETTTTPETAEYEQQGEETEQETTPVEPSEMEGTEPEQIVEVSDPADQKIADSAADADTSNTAAAEETDADRMSDSSQAAASHDEQQEESISQDDLMNDEVDGDIDRTQEETADLTEEITEEAVQEEKTSPEAAVVSEKMIDYGEAGAVEYFPADHPVRTNGFADDPVVDISSGRINAHAEGSYDYNVFVYNGDYQKVALEIEISDSRLKDPASTMDDYYILDEGMKKYNPTKIEVTGPGVKKTLIKKAYDWDYVYDSYNFDRCLRFPDFYIGHNCFQFDHVSCDNLAKRLKLPLKYGVDLGLEVHHYIMLKIHDFPLETLRKYETAREFAEAEGLLQDDREFVCWQEDDNKYHSKKESIEEKFTRLTEQYEAAGYKTKISTKYGYFIGLDPDSEYISILEEERKDGRMDAAAFKDGKYWYSRYPYGDPTSAELYGARNTKMWLEDLFGENAPKKYAARIAPYDIKTYYVHYEFSYADVVEAWLEEMDAWDGHWKCLLYGSGSVPEMEDYGDDDVPGYNRWNWAFPTRYIGKITLHYPDQYDFYVKEPGVYTVTATIEGCTGVIRNQFKVVKDIESCTFTGVEEKRYTEDELRKALVIKDGKKTLKLDKDYTITCTNHSDGSVDQYTVEGAGLYNNSVNKRLPFIEEEKPVEPAPVSNLAASRKVTVYNVAQGLKVTWEKVDGAARYNVYRGGLLIKTTSRPEITDSDIKIFYGLKFTYAVFAVSKEGGESTKCRTGAYYRLKPVGIKSLKNISAGKVAVDYDYSFGNSGYVVRFSTNQDMSDAKVITVKGNTTRRVLSGLKKGKTYYVQVRAYRIENGVRYYSGYCTTKSIKVEK